jgi:predicted PurR-regulated permease PerM
MGLGRVISVWVVVCLAFLMIVSTIAVVVHQLAQMGPDLPRYQVTISEKIRALAQAMTHWGPAGKATQAFEQLSHELSQVAQPLSQPAPPQSPLINGEPKPVVVEIARGNNDAIAVLVGFLSPLVDPLLKTGLVAVFVIFILLQREDLRDRLIRLLGSGDLQRTNGSS